MLSSRVGVSPPNHRLLRKLSPAWGYCHCCGAGRGLVVCRFGYSQSAEGPEKSYQLSRNRSACQSRYGGGGGTSYRRATNTPAGRTPTCCGAQREGGAHNVMGPNATTGLRQSLFSLLWLQLSCTPSSRNLAQYLAASAFLHVWQPKYSAVLCAVSKVSSACPRTTYVEGG